MFRMPISDVFFIRGRGTVLTGQVEAGTLRVGDQVLIGERSLRVDGIEAFRKLLDEAHAGDNIGILFKSLAREDVRRGEVITAPVGEGDSVALAPGAEADPAMVAPSAAGTGAGSSRDARFEEVETQRTQFLSMREAGLMTEAQIDQALRGMIFAADGRQWLLKCDSASWYSSADGEQWRHDTPPS